MLNLIMPFTGNLLTTGMGILPHKEMERALALAMSVDIPFWPQLPRLNFFCHCRSSMIRAARRGQ